MYIHTCPDQLSLPFLFKPLPVFSCLVLITHSSFSKHHAFQPLSNCPSSCARPLLLRKALLSLLCLVAPYGEEWGLLQMGLPVGTASISRWCFISEREAETIFPNQVLFCSGNVQRRIFRAGVEWAWVSVRKTELFQWWVAIKVIPQCSHAKCYRARHLKITWW